MNQDIAPIIARLSSKPWNLASDVPASIYRPVGMIGPEERRALWWLAREVLRDGAIVDAGSFLGASAFCLAAGAVESPYAAGRQGPMVHAFDRFEAIDQYVVEGISQQVKVIAHGDSFLDLFVAQVAPFASAIKPVMGEFLEATWDGGPIDLLFVDIAGRESLNAHAISTFFPHLVPGRSVVLQKAFNHCWHPEIHVSMEYLADEFELVDELVEYQSRMWLLVRPIPAEKLRRLAEGDVGADERYRLLDRLVERSSLGCRPMMELVRVWQRVLDGDLDRAAGDLRSLHARFDRSRVPGLWAMQAAEVESRIVRRRAASDLAAEETSAVEACERPVDDAVHPGDAPCASRHGRRSETGASAGSHCLGRMPDFLVIGAQKAGTTWLHSNVADHPDIWVPPIKELHYLNQRFAPSRDGWEAAGRLRQVAEARSCLKQSTTPSDLRISHERALALCSSAELDDEAYRAIFGCAGADQVCGEICPDYCTLPPAAILHVVQQQPAIQAVLILRDPVERAISNMTMAFQQGYGCDPGAGIPERELDALLRRSDYPAMIRRWRGLLPSGSLHVLAYDDIRETPGAFLEGFCRIIGVRADESLFPRRHETIFRGEPQQVHANVVAQVEERLAFVYEELRELAPSIAARWAERRRVRAPD